MKPVKSLSLIANWCLRISVLLFMITTYWSIFVHIDFQNLNTFILIGFVYCLFGLLLFIGGFQKKASLTVISGIIVFLISIYFIVVTYNEHILDISFLIYFFPCSIGLYFVANGNN